MNDAPLTLHPSPRQRDLLRRVANRAGVPEEDVALRLIETATLHDIEEAVSLLAGTLPRPERGPSVHDLASDLIGSVDGPSDLSSNPAYLEGYGR